MVWQECLRAFRRAHLAIRQGTVREKKGILVAESLTWRKEKGNFVSESAPVSCCFALDRTKTAGYALCGLKEKNAMRQQRNM